MTIKCSVCGREIKNITAAKNDGWILDEADKNVYFCCCVCVSEYNKRRKKKQ